jgi:hypothetical protein
LWAPKEKRNLFASFVRDNLKGSGDIMVFLPLVFITDKLPTGPNKTKSYMW